MSTPVCWRRAGWEVGECSCFGEGFPQGGLVLLLLCFCFLFFKSFPKVHTSIIVLSLNACFLYGLVGVPTGLVVSTSCLMLYP